MIDLDDKHILATISSPDPTNSEIFHQIYGRLPLSKTPEGGLWIRFLELAIDDLLRPVYVCHHKDALTWVNDAQNEDIGSFFYVCSLFGSDASTARKNLLDQLARLGGTEAVTAGKLPRPGARTK